MKRSILTCTTAAGLGLAAFRLAGLGLTGLGLAACGQGQGTEEGASATSMSTDQAEDDKTYAATGSITAIAGNQVTIAHGPVKGLDWPAQTADFQAQNLDQIIDLRPGDKVSFTFNQAGGQYVLVSIQKRGN